MGEDGFHFLPPLLLPPSFVLTFSSPLHPPLAFLMALLVSLLIQSGLLKHGLHLLHPFMYLMVSDLHCEDRSPCLPFSQYFKQLFTNLFIEISAYRTPPPLIIFLRSILFTLPILITPMCFILCCCFSYILLFLVLTDMI